MRGIDTAWSAVLREAERLASVRLRDLFTSTLDRVDQFSLHAGGIHADVSKDKLDDRALACLLKLAREAGLVEKIRALFDGAIVNDSEGRAALHMALRDGVTAGTSVDGVEVLPIVQVERSRMLRFVESVLNGNCCSAQGQPFNDVISIGIGGSDLGAAMVVKALAPWHEGPKIHFVSNVDGSALTDTTKALDPARTLVLVTSKSFATLETMTNAQPAKLWLEAALGPQAGHHMVAISSNRRAVAAFGIPEDRTFIMWDWVGGRYSIWSLVGPRTTFGKT